jgi:hypothetical protein
MVGWHGSVSKSINEKSTQTISTGTSIISLITRAWTAAEDKTLLEAVKMLGGSNWIQGIL